ncbi:MAG: sigma-54-dependent Fis family transcriptional regulator [Zoogloea sp.]|nr:sigma-54-dependent Fis family transcriptional regulator [Zoogloea sp.]
MPHTSDATQAPPPTIQDDGQLFQDPRSAALLERIGQVAPSDASVLVMGETGTGKEVVARRLHAESRRQAGPFVAVNCGAFSPTLVEAELFGHEKGAFTGAFSAKAGWFEAANGGTLFLDEIGELPPAMQVKLLRVLQEREVTRLGARVPTPIDVRVIAATNVRLEDAVAAGQFREDLYYRLRVVALEVPALRERPGDILPLARRFVDEYRRRLRYGEVVVEPAAERRLLGHPWPGNVRELENVIHHALLVCRGNVLRVEDLRLREPSAPATAAPPGGSSGLDALNLALQALFEGGQDDLFEYIENTVMRAAFEFCDGNQVQAARLLGISRNVMRARLIRMGAISALR